MVHKDHRGTLVAVTENLGFHAIQAQLNGDFRRIAFFPQDRVEIFSDDGFNGQRRNVAGASDGYRNTTDPSAFCVKALVDSLAIWQRMSKFVP